MRINNPINVVDYIKGVDGTILKTQIVEIGAWNMDTTASITIVVPGVASKVRHSSVTVMSDDGGSIVPIYYSTGPLGAGVANGSHYLAPWNPTNTTIGITRVNGGYFDAAGWASVLVNRGWVFFWFAV